MKGLVPVENCTGCAACDISCPKNAIAMKEDSEGFLYPHINSEKCDICGICIKICPVQTVPHGKSKIVPTLYAGWTNDENLLNQSSSGGVFSELADNVICKGGVVFGAAYDKTMKVRHVVVETNEDLKALRGSKYVQSDVSDTYAQVQKYLKEERQVLFSGTPCQIVGLRAVIKKGFDNLLTCDLLCHGVPSPKVFRMAINSIEKRYGSKVVGVFFREKSCGWLYPTIHIEFANGRYLNENNTDNHFNLGFLKNIYLRPSCYQCPIKPGGPKADITLGDFWELLKYNPSLINRDGTSAILINTEKGRQMILKKCSGLTLEECPFSYVEKDSSLYKSAKLSPVREAFFSDIDLLSFEKLSQKYIKPRNKLLGKIARIRRVVRKKREEWK